MNASALACQRAPERAGWNIPRRIFSFPVMLASLLVLLGMLTVRSRFDDPDMWWHLRMGQIVWTTHTVPRTDLFSFTTGHHAWVPHEWLSQVTIYGAYRWAGYSGLMAWLWLLTSLVLVTGYVLCSLYAGNWKTGFPGAMLIWFFSTIGLAVRPQMVGYLLLMMELLLLHLGRRRDARWFFCLPVLFAVWVNCHGSFFLGLIVGGLVFFCSLFEMERGIVVSKRWEDRQRVFLGMALVLSVAALFLNPVGIKQILYPLDTFTQQPVSLHFVEEWQPLRMSGARGVGLMATLGCVFLVTATERTKLKLNELLLLGLGTWLAVSHERMVFVFGILAAPIVSRLLAPYWEGYKASEDRILPNAVLTLGAIVCSVLAFPKGQTLGKQVMEGSPVQAVQYIQKHHLSGNMLNEYGYGGYLIWAAPEHPVFVDGRADVYEWTGVMAEFGRWATLQEDPQLLLNKYGVDICLLSRGSPMVPVMKLLKDWKPDYSDDLAMVFVRNGSQGGAYEKASQQR